MVDTEVIKLAIPAEEVASLIVHHQLLNEFLLLKHIKMQACRWLTSPILTREHLVKSLKFVTFRGNEITHHEGIS